MSTLSFAMITNRREEAEPQTSTSTSAPGVTAYVDAVAALVPAEVLTLHALIISYTTKIEDKATTITDPATLTGAFWALAVLAMVLYVAPRLFSNGLDRWDWIRILIPPIAFLVWTMLQRSTAFDAAFPSLAQTPRTVYGVIIAVVLGIFATGLAYKADQKPPPPKK
jgi:hypothetical protein